MRRIDVVALDSAGMPWLSSSEGALHLGTWNSLGIVANGAPTIARETRDPDPEVPPDTDVQGTGWRYIVSSYTAAPGDTITIDVWCTFFGQGGDLGYARIYRADSPEVPWDVFTEVALDADGRGVLELTIPMDAPTDVPSRISIACVEDGDQVFGDQRTEFTITSIAPGTVPTVAGGSTTELSVTSTMTVSVSTIVPRQAQEGSSMAVGGGVLVAAAAVAAFVLNRRRHRESRQAAGE